MFARLRLPFADLPLIFADLPLPFAELLLMVTDLPLSSAEPPLMVTELPLPATEPPLPLKDLPRTVNSARSNTRLNRLNVYFVEVFQEFVKKGAKMIRAKI